MDFSTKNEANMDMRRHVKEMLEEFLELGKQTAKTPAGENLFNANKSPLLDNKRAESFHAFVAKCSFLTERARPDTVTTVAFLCARVQKPTEEDWTKLIQLMKYLSGTRDAVLRLSALGASHMKWFADASFAVHPDVKSHTGYTMTMGRGSIVSNSVKQKSPQRVNWYVEIQLQSL